MSSQWNHTRRWQRRYYKPTRLHWWYIHRSPTWRPPIPLSTIWRTWVETGCFINPVKTRILTSTNKTFSIPYILSTNPALASDITKAIATYSTKSKKSNPSQPTPITLTDEIHLLGILVIDYINKQLITIKKQSDTIHNSIYDPQTRLQLFKSCTLQRIPHLLLTDALHNLNTPTLDNNTPFTRFNGPLTSAVNNITSNYIATLHFSRQGGSVRSTPKHAYHVARHC